jgi:hypothetical protein
MKIENLRTEKEGHRSRVAATVSWEDSDRPSLDMFFETDDVFEGSLSCNPHAFLVGSIIPAMRHGEKRLWIDAEVCPELREGLITALSWIRHWYYSSDKEIVKIESRVMSALPGPRTPERAGFFFSGGIDSLAALRNNRLHYPMEHPLSFRDGLLIFGQNIESDNRPEVFIQATKELSEVAREAGITLIPVFTNVRDLDQDTNFFLKQFLSAILSSVAHAFSRRLTNVSIASGDDISSLSLVNKKTFKPLGSHPLLDPNYSSCDLRIRHTDITLSRLDKTRLIAGWDIALQNIRVCGANWPGTNCCKCEKCIRTMLALLAIGALDKARSFLRDDITVEMMSSIKIKRSSGENYSVEDNYLELIPLLKKVGRSDIVHEIQQMLELSNRKNGGVKKKIRHLDQQYCNGSLGRIRKFIGHRIGTEEAAIL